MYLNEADYYNILAYALLRGEVCVSNSDAYMFCTNLLNTVIVGSDSVNLLSTHGGSKVSTCIYQNTLLCNIKRCADDIKEDIYDTMSNVQGAQLYKVHDIGSMLLSLTTMIDDSNEWTREVYNDKGKLIWKSWINDDVTLHYIPNTGVIIVKYWKYWLQYAPNCEYWNGKNVFTNKLYFEKCLYSLRGLYGEEYYVNNPVKQAYQFDEINSKE